MNNKVTLSWKDSTDVFPQPTQSPTVERAGSGANSTDSRKGISARNNTEKCFSGVVENYHGFSSQCCEEISQYSHISSLGECAFGAMYQTRWFQDHRKRIKIVRIHVVDGRQNINECPGSSFQDVTLVTLDQLSIKIPPDTKAWKQFTRCNSGISEKATSDQGRKNHQTSKSRETRSISPGRDLPILQRIQWE